MKVRCLIDGRDLAADRVYVVVDTEYHWPNGVWVYDDIGDENYLVEGTYEVVEE